jgi:Glycosidases
MVDAVNMLVTLLPGTAVTYNGEETGMTDMVMESPNDSRDPERTPFQWDDSISAGNTLSGIQISLTLCIIFYLQSNAHKIGTHKQVTAVTKF